MTRTSELLMSDTTFQVSATGNPVRANGWFGCSGSQQTVQITVSNFTGRVGIQGTLAVDPKDGDWFPIYLNTTQPFLIYPRSLDNVPQTGTGETSTLAFNFYGNFIWIRAIMDRENLGYEPDEQQLSQLGNVNKILLSR